MNYVRDDHKVLDVVPVTDIVVVQVEEFQVDELGKDGLAREG